MITITPAYGRDYRSKKAAQADLDAGRDFILCDLTSPWDGRPINRPQLAEQGARQVNVRFGKGRKVAVLTVKP
jgi:hypothetical protein